NERLGKLSFWLTFVGFNLTFWPMFVLGLRGMQRRVADYPANAGWSDLNQLATAGAYLMAVAVVVFAWNVVVTLRRRTPAEDDPDAEHPAMAGATVGRFSGGSVWPLVMGIACTLGVEGFIYGMWLVIFGLALFAVAAVGLMMESRG